MSNHVAQSNTSKPRYNELFQANALLVHEIKNLRADVEYLEEVVRLLKRQHFAPKSEVHHSGQGTLFNEAETIAATEPVAEEVAPESKGSHRGRPVRKPLPKELPRIVKIIDLPQDEKICKLSGESFVQIGEEVSEQLHIEPAKISVIETHRLKYVCECPQCRTKTDDPLDAQAAETTVKIAPVEAQPIPKSMASPSLLAHVAVGKYADALPLYRQTSILARSGIDLPRATLASWMVSCGELVRPILNLAREELLQSPIILSDETRLQILKQTGKTALAQSYMWVFMGGSRDGPPIILYELGPSRAHTVLLRFLEGYEGFLLTDGYEGYDTYAAKALKVVHVGDWVHVRRYFEDAVKAVPKDFKGEIKAEVARKMIDELFRIEREVIGDAPDDVRLRIRGWRSRMVVNSLEAWANSVAAHVPPKSLTGRALMYMKNQWPKLIHFLDHAILRLDTNPVENAIRPFVVGRNNWLFSSTVAGAEASAALYSMISMARANGLNPFEYLTAVFTELPKAKSPDDIAALLPWTWGKAHAAPAATLH